MSTILLMHSLAVAQQANDQMNWPREYDPSTSKFFVHNEIRIAAPAEEIWRILVDANTWPEWYEGASGVVVHDGSCLDEASVFSWKTMGLEFESVIKEYEAPYRLSWESKKKSIQGYHAWLIIPEGRECRVITDESQNGWLTFFEKIFQGKKLKRLHDEWLLALKKRAEAASLSAVSPQQ